MRSINIDQFMTPYNDLSEGYAAKARAQEGMTNAMANIGASLAQRKAQERSLFAQREEGALDRASRERMDQRRLDAAAAEQGMAEQKAKAAAENERSIRVGKIIAAHQDEADPSKRAALESQLANDGVTIGSESSEGAGSAMGEMEQGPTSEIDSVPDMKMDRSLQAPRSPLGFDGGLGFSGSRPDVKALSPGKNGEPVGADPALISPFGVGSPGKLSMNPMDLTPPSQGMFYMFKGQPIAPVNVTLGDAQQTRSAQAGSQIAPFTEGGTPEENATFGRALTGASQSAGMGVPVKEAVDTAAKFSGQSFQNESSKRHTPGGGGGGGGVAAAPGGLSNAETDRKTNIIFKGYDHVLDTNKANEKVERYETTKRLSEVIKNSKGLTDNLVKVELAGLYQKGVLSDKDFARSVGGESYLDQIRQWISSGMEGEMSPELRGRFQKGLETYRASAERDMVRVVNTTWAYVDNPSVKDGKWVLAPAWNSQFGQYNHLLQGQPQGGGPVPGASAAPPAPTPGTTGNKEANVIDNDVARQMREIDAALGL